MNHGIVLYSKRRCNKNVVARAIVFSIVVVSVILLALGLLNAQVVIHGRVMQVKDGDTIVVSPIEGGQFLVCRLYGIDAPEVAKKDKPGQPYGHEALKELKRLILGQEVSITLTGKKTYNREICIVEKDDMNVNVEMVRRGYAWAYKQYLKRPYASEYISAENEARAKRLGLWQELNPTPPWEFRR